MTPNVAGLEMAACFVLAILLWDVASLILKPWIRRAIRAALIGVAVAAVVGLAASGSRGGFLAAGTAVFVLAGVRPSMRWIALGLGVCALIGIAVSPHADRLLAITGDYSTDQRVIVLKGSAALIIDHPLGGIGLNRIAQALDYWYLPDVFVGRFATALNDGLTIAAAWGLPAMMVFFGVFGALLGNAISSAAQRSVSAALAVSICVVHVVAGLFQAHLFSGSILVLGGWSLGVGMLLLVTFLHRSRVALLWGAGTAVIGCSLACLVIWWLAEAPWKTTLAGELLVASPRHGAARFALVVTDPQRVPPAAIAAWIGRRQGDQVAISISKGIPSASQVDNISAVTCLSSQQVVLVANGDNAKLLWEAWGEKLTSLASVFLTNPSDLPSNPSPGTGILLVRCAKSAPFLDKAEIDAAVRASGQPPPFFITGRGGMWWDTTPWGPVFDALDTAAQKKVKN